MFHIDRMLARHAVKSENPFSFVVLREEIKASHRRSQEYGVSRDERTNQSCLTPAELAFRQAANKDFLDVAKSHIKESYDLLSPDEFMIAVVDREGYILHMAASDRIKALFADGQTQLGRVFVQEPMLPRENAVHVLDYERASEVIRTASHRAISTCYCRHKMEHMGRDCDAPKDICMTFNTSAASLSRHGHARPVDTAECLDLLDLAQEHGLVQFGENVRERVNFICNCCGCCCEAMIAARKFGNLHPVHTTNFLPAVDEDLCNGCGKCASACPVEAMGVVSANDPRQPKRKKARVDENICLGCGVCVRACPEKALSLKAREKRVITPLNSVHRTVVMALERGKLQNLIFDNRVLWNHRALAAVLGVILKLPPVKQAMATTQVKSRFMEYLVRKFPV